MRSPPLPRASGRRPRRILQFLIGADGRRVIADPLGFVVGKAPSQNNLRRIELLIEAAEDAMKAKVK